MKHKRITALLLACLTLFALAACTSSSVPPSPSQPGQTDAPSSTPPESDDPTAPPAESKTIHYWAMWNETETYADVLKEAITRYEAATGNKVEVNWLGRDVRTTLKAAIDAGETVDVIENTPDWLYPGLGAEYLLPMDEYLSKEYATTGGKTLAETIIPSYIDYAKTYTSDGSVQFIPEQPALIGMFYNKAIFAEVGVNAPPATWAELLDVCQKIKDAGYDPITVDDAYRPYYMVSYLLLQKGQAWFQELDADTTGEMWGDPAVLQVARALTELREKGYFSPTTPSNVFPAGQQELALGTTAIYLLNGSWLPNEIAATAGPDFKWGACAFPALPGADFANTTTQLTTQGFAISAKSANPDEAAELIAYFLDVPTQQGLADKAACVPVVQGVNWPDALADVKTLSDNMSGSFTVWGGQSDGTVIAALSENFGKLIAGNLTPEAFVDAMKAATKR